VSLHPLSRVEYRIYPFLKYAGSVHMPRVLFFHNPFTIPSRIHIVQGWRMWALRWMTL